MTDLSNLTDASCQHRCSTCVFWTPKNGAKDTDPQPCRRNPPTWRAGSIDAKAWFSAFPETFDDDWCGCWIGREAPTAIQAKTTYGENLLQDDNSNQEKHCQTSIDALSAINGKIDMSDVTKKRPRNRNALVHGLYAKDVLLPWDSKEDFEKLHEDLKAEFSPRGRAEEEAVLDLAFLYWRKQTLWRMAQSAVLKDPFTFDILQTERKSWSGIRKRLRAAANDARSLQGMAEANVAKFQSQVERWQRQIEKSTDKEEIKVFEGKISTCLRLMSEHAAPLALTLMQGPNAEQVNRIASARWRNA